MPESIFCLILIEVHRLSIWCYPGISFSILLFSTLLETYILDTSIVTEYSWFLKNKSDSLCVRWRHLIYLHYVPSYFMLSICPNFLWFFFSPMFPSIWIDYFFQILLYLLLFGSGALWYYSFCVYSKITCIINKVSS